MEKIGFHVSLPKDLGEALDTLTAAPGVTKSAIVSDALRAWLNRRAASELEERFSLRLDRMSNAISRVERDIHISLETLGLFVLYELTINAPLPEEDMAARAAGRARFNEFVDRVGSRLASGKRFLAWDKLSAAAQGNDA
jgi:Ribbon-helix-helix protein, copG family